MSESSSYSIEIGFKPGPSQTIPTFRSFVLTEAELNRLRSDWSSWIRSANIIGGAYDAIGGDTRGNSRRCVLMLRFDDVLYIG